MWDFPYKLSNQETISNSELSLIPLYAPKKQKSQLISNCINTSPSSINIDDVLYSEFQK